MNFYNIAQHGLRSSLTIAGVATGITPGRRSATMRVEAGCELAVAIAEQELGPQSSLLQLPLRARTWEVDLM